MRRAIWREKLRGAARHCAALTRIPGRPMQIPRAGKAAAAALKKVVGVA